MRHAEWVVPRCVLFVSLNESAVFFPFLLALPVMVKEILTQKESRYKSKINYRKASGTIQIPWRVLDERRAVSSIDSNPSWIDRFRYTHDVFGLET